MNLRDSDSLTGKFKCFYRKAFVLIRPACTFPEQLQLSIIAENHHGLVPVPRNHFSNDSSLNRRTNLNVTVSGVQRETDFPVYKCLGSA